MSVWRIGSNWGGIDIYPVFKKHNIAYAGKEVESLVNKIQVNDVIAVTSGKQIIATGKVKGINWLREFNQGYVKSYDNVKAISIDPYYFSEDWDNVDFGIYDGQGKQFHQAHGIYVTQIEGLYNKLNKMAKQKDIQKILEYKKQIILQGPPGTGKTRLAKLIAEEMTKAKVRLTPLQYVDYYIKNFKETRLTIEQKMARNSLLSEFQSAFPKADLEKLTLDTYCVGKGSRESFCYWIDRKLTVLGRFSPGLGGASVYGIFYSKEEHQYKSENISDKPNEAIKVLAKTLYNLVNNTDIINAQKYLRNGLILKILNTYYPENYFPIYSHRHLKIIARIFEIDTKEIDEIEINKRINAKFIEIKEKYSSMISNYDVMGMLYDKFKIKEGEDISDMIEAIDFLGEYKVIQFHPAYSYEDFVRGITAKSNDDNKIEYSVENKVIAQFAVTALKNPEENFILVIDEINRANLPAVLGELIYALEYRYDENDIKNTTVDSMYGIVNGDGTESKELRLPKNFYIIGTMNTADRSVGHIDYAIRRRFAFVDVLPKEIPELTDNGKKLFQKVALLFCDKFEEGNSDLKNSKYLAQDFKPTDVILGHSYFLIKEEDRKTLGKTDDEILEMRLTYEILPLLREYVKDGILLKQAEQHFKPTMAEWLKP